MTVARRQDDGAEQGSRGLGGRGKPPWLILGCIPPHFLTQTTRPIQTTAVSCDRLHSSSYAL